VTPANSRGISDTLRHLDREPTLMPGGDFGDYIVYVDESGDHSLSTINPEFPLFVLSFCIFPVREYVDHVVPSVQSLKFDFFGHDMVVLHEREIRKSSPPFDLLLNAQVRGRFMERLNRIVEDARFGVVACVIDKAAFVARRGAINPYHVALEFGLERIFFSFSSADKQGDALGSCSRVGCRLEDRTLETEFQRIMDSTRVRGMRETLSFACAPKSANSSGLQIADMTARPIGLHVLRPQQAKRAWDLIGPKLVRSREGRMNGYGLKVYP
jgi:hypothetical protein